MALPDLCSFVDMTNEEFSAFGIKNCALLKYEI